MNILLVDDEIIMLNILKQIIHWNNIGFENVYTARNATEARTVISHQHIDVTVCDIDMPQESGLDLIAWICNAHSDTTNIILTAHADFEYARSAISLGVYEFLLKPLNYTKFESILSEIVAKKREAQQLAKEFPEEGVAKEKEGEMVHRVRRYIDIHYSEAITRSDIEQHVHFNQEYVNRRFKQQTGMTLMEYIQACRIQRAKILLEKSQLSVMQISVGVGYDSQAYFAKVFKKHTCMTPVEYRKSFEN